MNKLSLIILLPILAFISISCTKEQPEKIRDTHTKEWRDSQTPQQILDILKAGNNDFAAGTWKHWDFLYEQQYTSEAQHPIAVVLSCVDSRAPAEILFNQGIGDIFNARVAGNFVNTDIAGSIEYACKYAGSKLVVVMGHTSCGAIKGACDHVEVGNITSMLANITPAVELVTYEGDRSSKNKTFVNKVAEANIQLVIEKLRTISPIIKEMEDNNEIMIVGCLYDITTGKAAFL